MVEARVPDHLAEYLVLRKPLDLRAIAALKKWAYVGLPWVALCPHHGHGGCCCCCCSCDCDKHGGDGEVSLSDSTTLWTAPGSYPRPEIVDIHSELTWQAPQGTTVTLEVQHLRANDTALRGWDVLFDNLPPTGFRVWDPPLVVGGGYGHRVCFRARTNTGLFSRVACRNP
jgi:hypothetical protein